MHCVSLQFPFLHVKFWLFQGHRLKRSVFLAGVLTSLRRCRLGLHNLDSLIMFNKNWPYNSRHDCEVIEVVKDVKDYFAKEMEIVDKAEDEE